MAPKRKAASKAKATCATKSKVKQSKEKKMKETVDKQVADSKLTSLEGETKETGNVVTPQKVLVPSVGPTLIFQAIFNGKSEVYIGPDAEAKCLSILASNPGTEIIQHESVSALAKAQAKAREKGVPTASNVAPVDSSVQAGGFPIVQIKKEPGVEENVVESKGKTTGLPPGVAYDSGENVPIVMDRAGPFYVTNEGKTSYCYTDVNFDPSVATGPYYVVKSDTDTNVFTGDYAAENLAKHFKTNPGCTVEHYSSYAEYKAATLGSPRGKDAMEKPIMSESSQMSSSCGTYQTPERTGSTKPVFPFMSDGSGTTGKKPNFQSVMQSSTALFGSSKIDIIVLMSPFINTQHGTQGIVFIHFASGKGDDPKAYWAVKANIMGSIFSGLDKDGFYSSDHSLPQGIFQDVNVAEMRASPHGPNQGLRSKKNSNYIVEIMYLVLKVSKSSLVSADGLVNQIGQRIKRIVSEPWFEDMYIEMAEKNITSTFAESLRKPKEKFFSLLKDSTVSYRKNVALDHYLLDDAINDHVRDYIGLAADPSTWPIEIKNMAYKDGRIPGANTNN